MCFLCIKKDVVSAQSEKMNIQPALDGFSGSTPSAIIIPYHQSPQNRIFIISSDVHVNSMVKIAKTKMQPTLDGFFRVQTPNHQQLLFFTTIPTCT